MEVCTGADEIAVICSLELGSYQTSLNPTRKAKVEMTTMFRGNGGAELWRQANGRAA
jgi:hypothetical protein